METSAPENMEAENNKSFLTRFYIYQKERFPLLTHGIMIAAFSFSAVSYSRICRGKENFIPLNIFLPGVFITISFFLLLRILDEFKDAEEDATYRKYLPVPRGLISLKELKAVGVVTLTLQLLVQAIFFPKMILLWMIAIVYEGLMGAEFFVPAWLKKMPMLYVISHMFIIPLVDIYASGLDWFLENTFAPAGLIFFLAVSYMNGIVVEFGRKIRPAFAEEEGVVTYSKLHGENRATLYWVIALTITLALSIAASVFAGYGLLAYTILFVLFILCCAPALLFIKNKTRKNAKMIEYASGVWTITMYLTLGGVPMLKNLFAI